MTRAEKVKGAAGTKPWGGQQVHEAGCRERLRDKSGRKKKLVRSCPFLVHTRGGNRGLYSGGPGAALKQGKNPRGRSWNRTYE